MAYIPRMEINGVVDTSKPVLTNLQNMANNSLTWLTWDTRLGKWRVILNRTASPSYSLTEADLIGSVSVTGSGINEIYNSVAVKFPNETLKGNTDEIILNIDEDDRYARELDNQLALEYSLCNNSIQAQFLGSIEMKQSRLDTIAQITVDWSWLERLSVGDVIELTLDQYDWNAKDFRIVKIEEFDDDDGAVYLSVTLIEYVATVYDDTGFTREERNRLNGIVPAETNICVIEKDDAATEDSLKELGFVTLDVAVTGVSSSAINSLYNGATQSGTMPFNTGTDYNIPAAPPYNCYINLEESAYSLQVMVTAPLGTMSFQTKIGGTVTERTGMFAYFPSTIQTLYSPTQNDNASTNIGAFTVLQDNTVDWQTQNTIIQITDAPAGTYAFYIYPLLTYDLDQEDTYYVFPYNYSCTDGASGFGATVTAYISRRGGTVA